MKILVSIHPTPYGHVIALKTRMDFNRREVCVLGYYLYQEIIALTCQGALQKMTIEMDRINFAYAKHSNHFFHPEM